MKQTGEEEEKEEDEERERKKDREIGVHLSTRDQRNLSLEGQVHRIVGKLPLAQAYTEPDGS